LINEEAEFFGLVSIVGQFYIFLIFDKNFSSSFNDLKLKLMGNVQKGDKNEITIEMKTLDLKNIRELIGDGRID
jgi:hypothetical protein